MNNDTWNTTAFLFLLDTPHQGRWWGWEYTDDCEYFSCDGLEAVYLMHANDMELVGRAWVDGHSLAEIELVFGLKR